MEKVILWLLLIIGIGLLILSFKFKKIPQKNKIIIFFLTAYLSTFIGVFVVENDMLSYPVGFLERYFDSSILFEYLLFPVISVYLYITSYNSKIWFIITQCFLYTIFITIVEVTFERYTLLIEYNTWTWLHSFIYVFISLILLRYMMHFIRRLR
jgi:hypothetical protein